ncbi:creatinase domain-containing protein [Toxoplasma gondii TgCatPRC2]|uniref:Creatinase domain-containing protein n=1 Tax=Toxoplasma gondii TgCatPRC2 TaxID=1130821 RepID=A0A151HMB0_TOXGO|nr:creatinase domain-containing protein [Toxoplasma gondii TgCatPRC2]
MIPLSFPRLRQAGGGNFLRPQYRRCRGHVRVSTKALWGGFHAAHAPAFFPGTLTSTVNPFHAPLTCLPHRTASCLSFQGSSAASTGCPFWLGALSAVFSLLTLSGRGVSFVSRRALDSSRHCSSPSACLHSTLHGLPPSQFLSSGNFLQSLQKPSLRFCSSSMARDGQSSDAGLSPGEKLSQMRTLMKDRNLDAFVVYSGDAHGSEIPAPSDERRQFLTGFDGSSGVAVVTADEALLWTDGRYFVQAEQQLDASLWTLMKQNTPGTPKVPEWLFNNSKVKRVGIDGHCTPISEYRQLLHAGFSPPSAPCLGASSSLSLKNDGASRPSDIAESKELILSENLVDLVWGAARPPAPCAEIHVHPLSYAGATTREKAAQVLQQMAAARCDVLLLSALDDVAWFLNLRGADVPCSPVFLSYCLIVNTASASCPPESGNPAQDASPLIVLYTNEARIKGAVAEELAKSRVYVRPYASVCNDLRHVLQNKPSFVDFIRKAGQKGNAEADVVNRQSDDRSKKEKTGAEMLWLDPTANVSIFATANECDTRVTLTVTPAAKQKAVKNPAELEGVKEAHVQDGVALAKFLTWLEERSEDPQAESFTEWEVAQVVDGLRALSPSFRGISFSTIASANANAAIVHYRPIREHSAPVTSSCLFLLDSGAHYAVGGTTDVTRTVHTGTPSESQKRYFTLVLKGFIGLSRQVFPQGTRGPQLDVLARQHLWASGLDYRHGTGHGVGSYLNVHEGPIGISPRLICQAGETDLAEGNVLSVEPGFYQQGSLGIRIENLVYVTKATPSENFENMRFLRFDQLTVVPIQKKLILPSLLTNEEIQWLNDYHQKVWTLVAPRLQEEAKQNNAVTSITVGGNRLMSVPSPDHTLSWLEKATAPLPLH